MTRQGCAKDLRLVGAEFTGASQCILECARYGHGADIDEVDMGVVVADVVSSLSATVVATDATIEVAELPTIQGDAHQLGRVLQNLLANSLKYRSETAPRVRIAAERPDGFWLFTVADNGVGIPPELGRGARPRGRHRRTLHPAGLMCAPTTCQAPVARVHVRV